MQLEPKQNYCGTLTKASEGDIVDLRTPEGYPKIQLMTTTYYDY